MGIQKTNIQKLKNKFGNRMLSAFVVFFTLAVLLGANAGIWATPLGGGQLKNMSGKYSAESLASLAGGDYIATPYATAYTIIYDANGGVGATMPSSSHNHGEESPLTENGYSKTGYTFAKWTSNQDGSGTPYLNEVGINLVDASVTELTLYAQWTANIYFIQYLSNTSEHTGSMVASSHTYDTEGTLTANGYSQTGYTFAGWNTKPDGTGTKYEDKASVTNLAEDKDDLVTLYAQWTKIGGGNEVFMIILTVLGGSAVVLLAVMFIIRRKGEKNTPAK
jgi:uncharacterized repeat protein (TIGR02543 family)